MQQSLGHGLAESAGGTPIVSLPGPRETIPWVTQYRSTWIVSGLDGLRYAGYLDRYTELLGPHRDQLLTCVAGIWLPIDVAFTHYDACERLRIPDHVYLDMVERRSQVRRAWHSAVIANVERAETPWSVLSSVDRIWARSADRGAVAMFQLAPNQARVEYVGCKLLDIPYFRRAIRVMNQKLYERACEGLVVHELSQREPGACSYVLHWR